MDPFASFLLGIVVGGLCTIAGLCLALALILFRKPRHDPVADALAGTNLVGPT